jgi:cytochrome P450
MSSAEANHSRLLMSRGVVHACAAATAERGARSTVLASSALRPGLQAVFNVDMTAKRAEIEAANQDVRDYVLDLVARRRQEPGEDLVSALVHHEQDGDRLSDDEIVTPARSVIAGGTETTGSQLAHGLRLFADHPDQWDRLGDNPALAEQACQEVLRFEPIVPFTARLVREECAA